MATSPSIPFFNSKTVMLCTINSQGYLQQITPAWTKQLGFTSDYLLTTSISTLLHPEDVEEIMQHFSQSQVDGTTIYVTNRLRSYTGQYQWFKWEIERHNSEQFYAIVQPLAKLDSLTIETIQEITPNTFLDNIINALPHPIFVTDRQHHLIFLNNAACQLLGKERAHLLNHCIDTIVPFTIIQTTDEQIFLTGNSHVVEETWIDAENVQHTLLIYKSLYTDSQQQFIINTITDITERKQTELALQESKEFLNKIINAIPMPLVVKDRQHRWILVNDAFCQLIGHPRATLLNKTAHNYFLKQEAEATWQHDEEIFITGKTIIKELTYTVATGTYVMHNRKTLYTDKQGELFIISCALDITEIKQTEQELRERDTLLQTIAQATQILLMDTNQTSACHKAMQTIAYTYQVDRVCLFENYSHPTTQELWAELRLEWIGENNDVQIKPHSIWQDFSYTQIMPQWYPQLASEITKAGNVDELPQPLKTIMQQTGVKSILCIPLHCGKNFWGMIAVEDYKNTRTWTENHIHVLKVIGDNLRSTLERHQTELALQERDRLLEGVAQSTQILLTSTDQYAGELALEILGRTINATHLYIFEHKTEKPFLHPRTIWSQTQTDEAIIHILNQVLSIEEIMPHWYHSLMRGLFLEMNATQIPIELKAYIIHYSPFSLLLIPILFEGNFWGIIGVEDHKQNKSWSSNYLFMLNLVGDSLRGAVEKLQAQQQLQQQLHRNHQILQAAMDGFHMVDPQGYIRQINPAFCHMLGYQCEELRDQSITLIDQSPIEQISGFMQLIREKGVGQFESRHLTKDGRLIDVEVNASFVALSTKEQYYFCFSRDITQKKQATIELHTAKEQAEAANQAKSSFLAAMSHEIRTPMNGIIGITDLLLHTSLDNQQRDYIETIRNSGESLLTIINDILDFSKIEAGKMVLESIEFDLRQLIEETINLFTTIADQKNIELNYQIPDITTLLRADPNRIRQILTNLISNALKFTEHGEVFLHITENQALSTSTHAHLTFEITDTGIGMTKVEQQRIFQPFTQADNSTTRRYGGTGLGLVIVQRLIQLMGSQIQLHSQSGQGSTFMFTLQIPKTNTPTPTLTGLNYIYGKKVLLIDNNTKHNLLLQKQLTAWQMQVESVHEPALALQKLRQAQRAYDVIMIDYKLPKMTGIALAQAIKMLPSLTHIPLIMLTSIKAPLSQQDTKYIAAHASKPVYRTKLLNLLLTALGKKTELPNKQPQTVTTTQPTQQLILLVEDNPTNQKVASLMLEKLGYQVIVADNGLQALDKLRQTNKIKLILMDCQMPEMDGFEATRCIRAEKNDDFSKIPIVALTANALQEDSERCLACGMNDYLSKPIKLQDLQAKLCQWLLNN